MSTSQNPVKSSEVMLISDLLETIGFSDTGIQSPARKIIETAGYTNPRKINIATDKARLIEAYVENNFRLVCSTACAAALDQKQMRPQLRVKAQKCEFCNGSKQNKLLAKMANDLSNNNLLEILVVGGSTQSANTLNRALKHCKINIKIVEGTKRTNLKTAKILCRSADVVVIWGATQLDHTVSQVFSAAADPAKKVPVARPGLNALADAMNIHLGNTKN